ncbi:lysophospholipid acyltransferase family protein [uncultured Jatrophihabitans sp.]|uniref:lysophospholipid acyltransferase family protein n=1 Tax=uncultured Jatrophihabitans sp. TaxID=1610747 RepID=UPI0035C9527C
MYAPTLADRITGSAALRRRQTIGRRLAHGLGQVQLIGLENVPATGAVVLAGNHRSALDGPLIFAFAPRPVTFLVKDEAFVGPLVPLLRGAGQVPVVRQRVDRAPIRLTLELLRTGGVVGIFPEGSRGDGLASTAKPGAAYLALRSGAAVVPVACHGTGDLLQHRWPRPSAHMVFGPAVPFARHPDALPLNRRTVAAATERIRLALADLVTQSAPTGTRTAA